ncbi:hypothetical protein, conserved, partial [Eimeria tenella]
MPESPQQQTPPHLSSGGDPNGAEAPRAAAAGDAAAAAAAAEAGDSQAPASSTAAADGAAGEPSAAAFAAAAKAETAAEAATEAAAAASAAAAAAGASAAAAANASSSVAAAASLKETRFAAGEPPGRQKQQQQRSSLSRDKAAAAAAAAAPATATAAAPKGQGLWHQVLKEARDKSQQTAAGCIIVLGCEDVGKTTLLQQLQQTGAVSPLAAAELHEDTGGVSSLDYAYLQIKCLFTDQDDAAEATGAAHVYVLQHPDAWEALCERVSPSWFAHLAILICVDLLRPSYGLKCLLLWLRAADKIAQHLLQQQTPQQQQQILDKTAAYLSSYKSHCLHSLLSRAPTERLSVSGE